MILKSDILYVWINNFSNLNENCSTFSKFIYIKNIFSFFYFPDQFNILTVLWTKFDCLRLLMNLVLVN